MNLISKPFLFNILIAICVALFLSQLSGLFLNRYSEKFIGVDVQAKEKSFNLSSALNIKDKPKPKQKIVKQSKKMGSKDLLLKDFSISGIILDGDNSMIIVRDKESGKFMEVGDVHKGYKLINIYAQKVKFSKNGDFYFAFLTPEDEKNFKSGVTHSKLESKPNSKSNAKTQTKRESVTGTTSVSMFEEIKYKNGKYFIPRDMMLEYTSLDKIFSGISIQSYSNNTTNDIKFRINYISSKSIFKKMGLRTRDFILKVNGEDFKSVSEPIKYFQNLKNIKELSLSIQRGKKIKELKYEIY